MKSVIRTKFMIIMLLLVFAAMLGLTACSGNQRPRYALCMSHLSNHFTNTLAGAIRGQANAQGIELIVLDARKDKARQVSQIETLLRDGIDGLIIEPTAATGLETVLQSAIDQKVPVVLVTQRVNDPELYDCFVGANAYVSGRLQMTACIDAIGPRGDLVILHGPVGAQASVARYDGYLDVLSNYPELRIVAELNADWDTNKAEAIVTNWLESGKQISAIVAQNDEMAIGAVQSIREAGLTGQIHVFGIDASDQALNAIRQGEMTATVTQQTAVQGVLALDACIRLSRGEQLASEILVSQHLIDYANIGTFQN